MRVRRTRYLFLYVSDGTTLDLSGLLEGRVDLEPDRRILALSILTGREEPLRRGDVDALLALPSEEWTEADGAAERLARKGLVVSDSDDAHLAELRRRERVLADSHWSVYSSLYHFMTRWRDVNVGLAPGPEAIELATGQGVAPPHFVRRGSNGSIELPLPTEPSALRDLLRARRTTRDFDPDVSLRLEDVSRVLHDVFGCHGYLKLSDDAAILKKTSPSGGSLHPTEVYALVLRVQGLEPGLYHYDASRHELGRISALDGTEAERVADTLTAGQTYFAGAGILFLLTTRFARSFWRYRDNPRAYRVLLMDAAHLSQTLYLVATELGLGAFVTAAINDENVEELLGVDGFEEAAIAICGCGTPLLAGSSEPDFLPYVPRETTL